MGVLGAEGAGEDLPLHPVGTSAWLGLHTPEPDLVSSVSSLPSPHCQLCSRSFPSSRAFCGSPVPSE